MSVIAPEPAARRSDDPSIARYARIAAPAGIVVLAIVGGVMRGPQGAILALAAGALLAVIAVLWASLRTFLGETPLAGADAYALGALSTEEEQKRAVLRALQDLKFERSVGKISEEDYLALTEKYRGQAKRLLRALDADAAPERREVEALIAKRLKKAGLAEGDEAEADEVDEPAPAPTKKGRVKAAPKKATAASEPAKIEADRACASCGTSNDEDAVFCKKCGARQGPEAAESEADVPAKNEETAG